MSKSYQSNYGKNSKDSMLRISWHTKHENMSNVDYHLIHHLKEILVLVTCAVHKETYVCFFQLEKHFMTGIDMTMKQIIGCCKPELLQLTYLGSFHCLSFATIQFQVILKDISFLLQFHIIVKHFF